MSGPVWMKFGRQMLNYVEKTANIIVKKLEAANITNNDIASQHSGILAMCCNVISSYVIFAVLDLRVGGCRP